MVTLGAILLVCLTVICVVMLYVAANQSKHNIDVNDRNRLQKITDKKPTHFVDEGHLDSRCEICFGDIGNETIRVCDCGRTFHVDCADATDECPYCKRKKETMTERNAVKTVCPACGRLIEKNICDCGAIVPNPDGTYVCRCGESASIGSGGCGKCGSTITYDINNKI